MRNRILAAAAAFTFLAAGAAFAGQWSTSYGTMNFPDTPQDTALRIAYPDDGGRVIGQMSTGGSGATFSGVWVEGNSARECSSKKDGSAYWGNVTFSFNAGYDAFTGRWDYCGEGGGSSWNGQLGRGLMKSMPKSK